MHRRLLLPSASCGGWLLTPHGHQPCAASVARPLASMMATPHCPLSSSSTSLARDVRVHGRKDGYSAARKSRQAKRRGGPGQGARGGDGTEGAGNQWWEQPEDGQQQRPDSAARQPNSDGRPLQRRGRGGGTFASSMAEDETGWWQKPEERTLEAYAPRQLQQWQVEQLEKAYAKGRRKVKIQELAQELGLDRSEVIFWMKEFALRPDSERQAILARHEPALREQQQLQQQQQQQQEPQQQRLSSMGAGPRRADPAPPAPPSPSAPTTLPDPSPQTPSGFIPYYTRKELGMTDPRFRRLSADSLRTLEAIYTRTPFPSNEVIRGVWDLHRLSRETVLGWLSSRRAEDGIMTSEQKRVAAGGAPGPFGRAREGPDGVDGWSERDDKYVQNLSEGKLRQVMGSLAYNSDNLLVSSTDAQQQQQQQAQEEQQPQVVTVSERQLAMLKSSLPSPKKFKGQKRNEQMGIKGDAKSLKVGAVQYVEATPPPTHTVARWVAKWRLKKAQQERTLLPLIAGDDE